MCASSFHQVALLQAELAQLRCKYEELLETHQTAEREQEDLLVLLAEQETKMTRLRERLVQQGVVLSDEEDDGDDEGEEVEGEDGG